MHAYIRLLLESLPGFRALMTSARARLIDLSASQALGHSRLWARRSDLFSHHSDTLASYGRILVWNDSSHSDTATPRVSLAPATLLRLLPSDRLARSPSRPRQPARSCWPRRRRPGSIPAVPSVPEPIDTGGRASGPPSVDNSWPRGLIVSGDSYPHVSGDSYPHVY